MSAELNQALAGFHKYWHNLNLKVCRALSLHMFVWHSCTWQVHNWFLDHASDWLMLPHNSSHETCWYEQQSSTTSQYTHKLKPGHCELWCVQLMLSIVYKHIYCFVVIMYLWTILNLLKTDVVFLCLHVCYVLGCMM